ncbi:MAG: histidine kinase dimerization/phosphoacceptor domain -containing protein [Spirochaetales bacterium]|nr:histidine kinase dimerization/phosphoacceptor domain -containing protein [Spirochaetales bacterium]
MRKRSLSFINTLTLRQKIYLTILSYLLYATSFLLLTPFLKISVNYLIIIPILTVAFCFGQMGGLISGFLGLPLNLILFYLKGYPECAPASLPMAEISGIVVGTGLGSAGSYLKKTSQELAMRLKREEELKTALDEKEVLYKELNHRVKNNLNIIKSLIQMQVYRTESEDFKTEGSKLINRILSISLVHEQLYRGHIGDKLNLKDYLVTLIRQILESHSDDKINLLTSDWNDPHPVATEQAIQVGLIINEVVTNSIKYAFPEANILTPEIHLDFKTKEDFIEITLSDNGRGKDEKAGKNGLGMTLIKTLTKQLGGNYSYVKPVRGTKFILTFPCLMEEIL